jgi:hypothetical protein
MLNQRRPPLPAEYKLNANGTPCIKFPMRTFRRCLLSITLGAACSTLLALPLTAHATTDTQTGGAGAAGANGTNGSSIAPATAGNPGGSGVPATADAGFTLPNLDATNIATATGGAGGAGGTGGTGNLDPELGALYEDGANGGAGGAGGDANVRASTNTTANAVATVTATGGAGGAGGASGSPGPTGVPGNGGTGGNGGSVGGTAFAQSAGTITVSAALTGGVGGAGGPSGAGPNGGQTGQGGNGGGVMPGFTATGISTGGGAVNVTVTATGGAGGAAGGFTAGSNPFSSAPGAGGSAFLNNSAVGSTSGSLLLRQIATGGAGAGSTNFASAGGNATSILNQTTVGLNGITAMTLATGGQGGSPTNTSAPVGLGGNALAQTTLTGAGPVNVSATSTGGASGATGTPNSFGTASALASATSSGGSFAQATSSIIGVSGAGQSLATSRNPATGTVRSVQASGSLTLPAIPFGQAPPETLNTFGSASIGGTMPARTTLTPAGGNNAGAMLTGAPSAAMVSGAMSGHPNVSAVFGSSSAETFELAVMAGGASSTAPTNMPQTFSSAITLALDTTQLASASGHLVVGLLDPLQSGAGFGSMRFQLQVNGVTKEDQSFVNFSLANAYFTDNVIDLGNMPGGAMTLTALLDVTTLNAGDGYNVSMLVGNNGIVPEPSTWAMVIGGLALIGVLQRARRTRQIG